MDWAVTRNSDEFVQDITKKYRLIQEYMIKRGIKVEVDYHLSPNRHEVLVSREMQFHNNRQNSLQAIEDAIQKQKSSAQNEDVHQQYLIEKNGDGTYIIKKGNLALFQIKVDGQGYYVVSHPNYFWNWSTSNWQWTRSFLTLGQVYLFLSGISVSK